LTTYTVLRSVSDALRQVRRKPLLDGGAAYLVVVLDVAHALGLAGLGLAVRGVAELGRVAVVELLEVGERRRPRLLREEPEELLFVIRARVPDVVVVRVVEAEQRLLDALVVEVPGADDGLVLLRQPGDEPIFVHVVAVVTDEHEVDGDLLVEVGPLARLEVL
jgi:hypothetical protein